MPLAHELPEPLRPLARRQALEIRDTRGVDDITHLVDAINRLAPVSMATQVQVGEKGNSHRFVASVRGAYWVAVAIVAVALVVAIAMWQRQSMVQRENPTSERQEGILLHGKRCGGQTAVTVRWCGRACLVPGTRKHVFAWAGRNERLRACRGTLFESLRGRQYGGL